jgi:signal transduction histidine kinase
MSLQKKILIFTLPLTLIPFLLLALAVYTFVIRSYQIQIEEEQKKLVAEAVVNLRKEQELARRDVEIIAGLPAVSLYLESVAQGTDLRSIESEVQTILQLFANKNPYYLQLSLVDTQGQERIKISKLPGTSPLRSLKGEEYFRRTLISGSFQSPVESVRPDRFASVLTCRVRREKFLGAAILYLNADVFQRALRPLLTGHGLATILFDDRGIVFAKSFAGADEENCLQQIDLAPEAKRLLAMPSLETARREVSYNNRVYLFSVLPAEAFIRSLYEPQSGENWFLGVLQPKESRLGLQILFSIILVSALGAMMWAVTRYSRRITVPLEQVAEATSGIARGNFDISLSIKTGDEVEDLAMAVKRMADDLKTYRAELVRSAKLASIGEMASEISHEIQNRISGVSLWTQYLDNELEKEDPRREYLEEMKEGLRGFQRMLQELKQFYKTPILQLCEANLNDLVKDSLLHIEQQVKEKSIEVELQLDSELPAVNCDGEKIKSVIINLLLNAAEAVENGGRVKIETRSETQAALLLIEDNGCGIAEEDLPRIFYPFYSTKGGGGGLGLAIASNLVSAHGGEIRVKSSVGKGTTFTVVLR